MLDIQVRRIRLELILNHRIQCLANQVSRKEKFMNSINSKQMGDTKPSTLIWLKLVLVKALC